MQIIYLYIYMKYAKYTKHILHEYEPFIFTKFFESVYKFTC